MHPYISCLAKQLCPLVGWWGNTFQVGVITHPTPRDGGRNTSHIGLGPSYLISYVFYVHFILLEEMINQLGVFIDKHHRVIRAGLYVVGVVGCVIVVRNTHVLRVYRNVTAVPQHAIQQQHLLRGVVRNINTDCSLSVAHQPLLLRNFIKARDNETINIRLTAVQPQHGFSELLKETVLGKRVRFSLLNQNADVADAVVYMPGSLFSRRVCVNEMVISEGVGIVETSPPCELVRRDVYDSLTRVLLGVEVKADRKGRKGVWKKPSKLQVWKQWARSWFP